MAEKRACSGTTKAGKPCKAAPLKDSDVCLAHSDPDTRASTGFVPEAGHLGGRPRNPRAHELLREKLEAEIDAWLDVLVDARTAERLVFIGSGDDVESERVPDHVIRMKAFAEIWDRVYGKPKQATEISGPGGDAVRVEGGAPDLELLTPDELRAYLELVKKMRGDGGEQ